jgi:Zn-dependent alcohol dehydrogenase
VKVRAAVVESSGAPFEIEELDLGELRADEVLVRVEASGICHTDLICRDQWLPVPLPAVLGHEGAGVVEEVGTGVTAVAPGDRVVMSYGFCGVCEPCTRGLRGYCHGFAEHNFAGLRPGDGSSVGATAIIDAGVEDAAEAVRTLTRGGAAFSLEASGSPDALRAAVDCLEPMGVCGVTGVPALGTEAALDVNTILTGGRVVRGIVEGDSVSGYFLPLLLSFWRQGRFPVDRMIEYYDFDEIEQASRDAERGAVIKPVLRMH